MKVKVIKIVQHVVLVFNIFLNIECAFHHFIFLYYLISNLIANYHLNLVMLFKMLILIQHLIVSL